MAITPVTGGGVILPIPQDATAEGAKAQGGAKIDAAKLAEVVKAQEASKKDGKPAPTSEELAKNLGLTQEQAETLSALTLLDGNAEKDKASLPNKKFGTAEGLKAVMTPEEAKKMKPEEAAKVEAATKAAAEIAKPDSKPEGGGGGGGGPKSNESEHRAEANKAFTGSGGDAAETESSGGGAEVEASADSSAPAPDPEPIAQAAEIVAKEDPDSADEAPMPQTVSGAERERSEERERLQKLDETVKSLEAKNKKPENQEAYKEGAQNKLAEARGNKDIAQADHELATNESQAAQETAAQATQEVASSEANVSNLEGESQAAQSELMGAQQNLNAAMSRLGQAQNGLSATKGKDAEVVEAAQAKVSEARQEVHNAERRVREAQQNKRDADRELSEGRREHADNVNDEAVARGEAEAAKARAGVTGSTLSKAKGAVNRSEKVVARVSNAPQSEFRNMNQHLEEAREDRDDAQERLEKLDKAIEKSEKTEDGEGSGQQAKDQRVAS